MKRFIPFILSIILACSQGGDKNNMNQISDNINFNPEDIKRIASKKIYFGHQSVGYNIIDGLKSIVPSDSGLNIIESSELKYLDKPILVHSKNGQNKKPDTKIKEFENLINNSIGKTVEIAFFKFCYIDITAETDINNLFQTYQSSFNSLNNAYPSIKFIHITVPLTVEEQSLIGKLKFILKIITGKKNCNEYDNIQRMRFNKKLIDTYGKRVFDLACLESTKPDGDITTSTRGGATHYILLPEYSYDGGHLNKKGSTFIAYHLIDFISNIE